MQQGWIPLLIWSYGATTGPWAYMASQEVRGGGGDSSLLAVTFAQVAYVVMVVMGIATSASLIGMATTFGGIMLLYVAVQMPCRLSGPNVIGGPVPLNPSSDSAGGRALADIPGGRE